VPGRAGAATPFGPLFLRDGAGAKVTRRVADFLFGGEISQRAYAESIFPFICRLPETPGFGLSIAEVNEMPTWLARELIDLLPRSKEDRQPEREPED